MTKEDLQRALESAPDGCEVQIEDEAGDAYGIASARFNMSEDAFVIEAGDLVDDGGWDEDEGELDEDL